MEVSNKKSIILLGVFGMLALFIRVVLFYLIFLGSWKFFLGKRQLTDNLKALYIIGPAVILTKIQPAWFDLHATAREAFVRDTLTPWKCSKPLLLLNSLGFPVRI